MKKILKTTGIFLMALTMVGANTLAYANPVSVHDENSLEEEMVEEQIASGKCGETSNWNYDTETKILTITGSGIVSKLENFNKETPVEELVIKAGVEEIGESAFYEYHMNQIRIEDGLKKIDRNAFGRCTGVQEIVLPKSVCEICGGAFDEMDTLKKVTILGDVVTDGAIFGHLTHIETLELAGKMDNVAKVGVGEEAYMPDKIVLINDNPNYVIENGLLLSADKKTLCYVVDKTLQALVIPQSVKEIMPYAVYMHTLNNLDLCNVQEIGDYAFYYCHLEKLTVPKSVTKIGESAFSRNKIKKIKFYKNIKSIGANAFEDNDFKNVRFYNYPKVAYNAFERNVQIEHYGSKKVNGVTVNATVKQTKKKYVVALSGKKKVTKKCKITITQTSKNIVKTVKVTGKKTLTISMKKGQVGKVHKVYIRVMKSGKWGKKTRVL